MGCNASTGRPLKTINTIAKVDIPKMTMHTHIKDDTKRVFEVAGFDVIVYDLDDKEFRVNSAFLSYYSTVLREVDYSNLSDICIPFYYSTHVVHACFKCLYERKSIAEIIKIGWNLEE